MFQTFKKKKKIVWLCLCQYLRFSIWLRIDILFEFKFSLFLFTSYHCHKSSKGLSFSHLRHSLRIYFSERKKGVRNICKLHHIIHSCSLFMCLQSEFRHVDAGTIAKYVHVTARLLILILQGSFTTCSSVCCC